ncbi:MAG: slipin family protein [Candidatus Marinimicrobia bacterium]|nr:slipin family protein [Candidatus Neomarinimicrobiota bacterium]
METILSTSVIVLLVIMVLAAAIRILREYERGVVFRLGRLAHGFGARDGMATGPGLIFLIPIIDRMVRVSLRTVVLDVPPQDVITRDNVSLKVNAVIFFRVMDASKAILAVEDYHFAITQIAQTSLRSILGQAELDELLAERDKINQQLQQIIDEQTDPWGIKVSNVEVKHVDLPVEMQRAIAKQAEAERERRAKVIHSEGEYQAADKLAQAAKILSKDRRAIQLRFLQTLTEVATEKNSTLVFPVPIDLFEPFIRRVTGSKNEEDITEK